MSMDIHMHPCNQGHSQGNKHIHHFIKFLYVPPPHPCFVVRIVNMRSTLSTKILRVLYNIDYKHHVGQEISRTHSSCIAGTVPTEQQLLMWSWLFLPLFLMMSLTNLIFALVYFPSLLFKQASWKRNWLSWRLCRINE